MKIVEVEYIKENGFWTYKAQFGEVTVRGDLYPGTKKGLKQAKRDAMNAIKHLRVNNQIKVKR